VPSCMMLWLGAGLSTQLGGLQLQKKASDVVVLAWDQLGQGIASCLTAALGSVLPGEVAGFVPTWVSPLWSLPLPCFVTEAGRHIANQIIIGLGID
jgi:hypothetical protein